MALTLGELAEMIGGRLDRGRKRDMVEGGWFPALELLDATGQPAKIVAGENRNLINAVVSGKDDDECSLELVELLRGQELVHSEPTAIRGRTFPQYIRVPRTIVP